ncbi:MAG: hypothetical protein ACR2QK_03880, partial [Acidimicrobiales bacterium]
MATPTADHRRSGGRTGGRLGTAARANTRRLVRPTATSTEVDRVLVTLLEGGLDTTGIVVDLPYLLRQIGHPGADDNRRRWISVLDSTLVAVLEPRCGPVAPLAEAAGLAAAAHRALVARLGPRSRPEVTGLLVHEPGREVVPTTDATAS